VKLFLKLRLTSVFVIGCGLIVLLTFAAGPSRRAGAAARGAGSAFAQSDEPEPLKFERIKGPDVFFWAWERPEDFRFLMPGAAGVAFLAKTIYLQAPSRGALGSFLVRPRLQPLRITAGVPLTAVVRIENPRGAVVWERGESKPAYSAISYSRIERDRLAEEIADLQAIHGVSAIQSDFDAPASAHEFYAQLLEEVRPKLPPMVPLSITALASWCIGDRWLEKLPRGTIDEAVPMLFRMGPEAADVARFLDSGARFPVASCRGSLGLSTDEPLFRRIFGGTPLAGAVGLGDRRIYVFAPHSWSESDVEPILKGVRR
jgi:hypothetical protein